MVKVHLIGRVHPSALKISVPNLPSMNWVATDLGFSFGFVVTIQDSNIDVECSLPEYKSEYLAEIHRRAYDICRAAINLAAFSTGYGLVIAFDTFVDGHGTQTPLVMVDAELARLCTAFSGASGFDAVFRMVASEPILIRHLSDLIQAITVPHEAPMSCARAMDGLKHLIAAPSSNDNAAWQQMRHALRADMAYLKYITDSSKPGRHGKNARITGAVTTEAVRRSWTIMNRYFEYRKRGGTPLTETEFPMLLG